MEEGSGVFVAVGPEEGAVAVEVAKEEVPRHGGAVGEGVFSWTV